MKGALVAVVVAMLIECSLAVGQTGGAGSPVPGMGATSPLGMTPGSSVPPVGIPLGATEMVSPGLSPSLAAAGMAGSDPMCSAMGSPSAGASGSSINDGGGLGMGTGTPLPGSAISFGACSTNASSAASSSAAISSSSPGGISRTGIPLGSVKDQRVARPIVADVNDEPGADGSDASPIVTSLDDGHIVGGNAVATITDVGPRGMWPLPGTRITPGQAQ